VTPRQKILITGASSGLGEGMTRRCAARGRALGLAARRLERLETLAAELRPSAAQVAVTPLDVTDLDAVPVAFRKLADELGGLDRVIVNAGLGKGAPLGTGKAAANIETVQTNLVFIDTDGPRDATQIREALQQRGIRVSQFSPTRFRFAVHYCVDLTDADRVIRETRDVLMS